MFLNKVIIFIMLIFVFIMGSCDRQTTKPESPPSIIFEFVDGMETQIGPLLFKTGSSQSDSNNLEKALNIESVELVMVMILDFSMFDSSAQYFKSEDFKEFTKAKEELFAQDKLTQWAEWEKLLGDYFRLVADQNLNIDGHHATGIVAGVVGLNRVIVGMIGHGTIQYKYEGEVVAKAGETVRASLHPVF